MRFVIFSACLLYAAARAQDGIAIRYPGDAGIANDPDVLFTEDFENADLKKWTRSRVP